MMCFNEGFSCFLFLNESFYANKCCLCAAACCASLLSAAMIDHGMDTDGLLCAVEAEVFRSFI